MENNELSSSQKTKKISSSPELSSLETSWTHTQPNVAKASHIWRISNVSYLCQQSSLKLNSDVFSAAVNDNIKWRLELDLIPKNNCVVIKLHFLNTQTEVRAKCRIIVYDCMMREALMASKSHLFNADKSTLMMEIMRYQEDLITADTKFLSNDELTVSCEVKFVKSIVTIKGFNCDLQSSQNTKSQHVNNRACDVKFTNDIVTIVEKKNNPEFLDSKTYCLNILELVFNNKKWSDIKINIGSRTFDAHKAILATASPVFSAMFNSSMIETEKNCINIDDIDEDTFEEMLRFLYTGKVYDIENVIYSLFAAADKYNIDPLKSVCEKQLYKNLTAENSVNILMLADLHNSDWLKTRIINFIRSQIKAVTETEDFNSLNESHGHLLTEIIRSLAHK